MSDSEKNNEMMFFKEQKVFMLQTLWNQFFKKLRGKVSIDTYCRLEQIKVDAIVFFVAPEQASQWLFEYIREQEGKICSFEEGSFNDLSVIKDFCKAIKKGAPADILLGKYGQACRLLYGA